MATSTTSQPENHAPVYSTMIAPPSVRQEDTAAYELSKDGKHRVLPGQGREGMKTPGPINLDCWPAYRDKDEDAEVFFAVYKPAGSWQTPRDVHWSLAWAIRNTHAWRQVHVVEESAGDGPAPQPRYVFWGAMTKSAGPTDETAKKVSLGALSLAQRLRIEELARQTPVMVPDGRWNCQDWLLDLFERMMSDGVISRERRNSVLGAAGHGTSE